MRRLVRVGTRLLRRVGGSRVLCRCWRSSAGLWGGVGLCLPPHAIERAIEGLPVYIVPAPVELRGRFFCWVSLNPYGFHHMQGLVDEEGAFDRRFCQFTIIPNLSLSATKLRFESPSAVMGVGCSRTTIRWNIIVLYNMVTYSTTDETVRLGHQSALVQFLFDSPMRIQ